MLPALAVIAASALLNHENNRQAQKRREAIQRSMESYQRSKVAESSAATEELLKKQTPQQRETELANVTAERAQSMRDTVGAAQSFDAPPIAGKLSSDYRALDERNAATVAERTRRAIEQLASIGAPAEQGQRFGLRFGKAAGGVDAANNAIESVGRGYLTDIDAVRPDPTMLMLSQIGMAAGQGMLLGGGTPGAAEAVDAGGTGITAGASGEGLRVGAGDPSLRSRVDSLGIRPRLRNAFSKYGVFGTGG